MVCGAYGVVHHFPGGTQEQYEATLAAVHPTPDTLPEGQGSHVAGPSADGWMVTVVHESQNSWKRFRDDTLMPRMQQGIEGGSKRHLRSRRSTSTSRRRRGHRGTTPATNGSTSLISARQHFHCRRHSGRSSAALDHAGNAPQWRTMRAYCPHTSTEGRFCNQPTPQSSDPRPCLDTNSALRGSMRSRSPSRRSPVGSDPPSATTEPSPQLMSSTSSASPCPSGRSVLTPGCAALVHVVGSEA
jgi:hypothetical protein